MIKKIQTRTNSFTNTFIRWVKKHGKEIFAVFFFIVANEARIVEGIQWELKIHNSYRLGEIPQNEEQVILGQILGQFVIDASRYGMHVKLDDVTFDFADELDNPKADKIQSERLCGVCYPSRNHIILSREYLKPELFQEFKATVYHELGHCIYNMGHYEHLTPTPHLMFKQQTNWDTIVAYDHYAWERALYQFFADARRLTPHPRTFGERVASSWKEKGQRIVAWWGRVLVWFPASKSSAD